MPVKPGLAPFLYGLALGGLSMFAACAVTHTPPAQAQQPDWLLRYPTRSPNRDPCQLQNENMAREIERLRGR